METEENETEVWDQVPGGEELRQWFGQIPSFHDAEIIDLCLRRRGQSAIRIHVWLLNKGEDGFYTHDKDAVITFTFEEVTDIGLLDFNSQNVIDSLGLIKVDDGFELSLEPCWGLYGKVRARSVKIQIKPGLPDDSLARL